MDFNPLPSPKDPLGEALHQLHLNGTLYCRCNLAGKWSLEIPVMQGYMMFHIVTAGEMWLKMEGENPRLFKAGEKVLIPHGKGHIICNDTTLPSESIFDAGLHQISERYEVLDLPGPGPKTELTCGVVSFDEVAGDFLIRQLPRLLLLTESDNGQDNWCNTALELITNEARDLKPGGETIITHLADIIIIQLIRNWLENEAPDDQGWLAALKDKHIGIALRAIHAEPERDWSVESLAKHSGMSRSGFSARFTRIVGNTVKNYLLEWRMKLAYRRLKHKREPLIVLAEDLGYQSEAAFSRAFKRVIGVSPAHIESTPH